VAAVSPIRVFAADSRPLVLRGLAELINTRKPLMELIGAASNYARTVELAGRLNPEVVLFSFFQDAMDGMDVLTKLIHGGAKVLLLKGRDESAPIGRALELGARGVVLTEDSAESIVQAIIRISHVTNENGKAWIGGLASYTAATRSTARPHGAEQVKLSRLTTRELELIRAIMEHPAAKYLTIGAMLGITEHTVHNHLTSIYQKLDLVNRIELLVYAVKHQLDGSDGPMPSGWVDLE